MIDLEDITKRKSVDDIIKSRIRESFLIIPEGKKNALVAIWDFEEKMTRIHFAWKISNTWKVGSQVGWTIKRKPEGYVGIEAAW